MLDDVGDLVSPGEFLGIAERYGLIHSIDRWVAREAIRTVADLPEEFEDYRFSINLSGKAFADRELIRLIKRELDQTSVSPERLTIEITETAVIADTHQARKLASELREIGCRFALDDFGVGFSSLNHIKSLPVDYLKIDGSFVRELPHSPVDRHLVRAVAGVARALGKETVAEFVGDAAALRVLQELGVDYAQGYHVGRPISVSSLLFDRHGLSAKTRELARI